MQFAIGLVFVFVLIGFACSFLNELVAAALNRRTIHLQRWLMKLLKDDGDRTSFFGHPLIRELRRTRLDLLQDAAVGRATAVMWTGRRPAFALSLRGRVLVPERRGVRDHAAVDPWHRRERGPGDGRRAAYRNGRNLHNAELQKLLRTLLADAGGEVEQFKRRVMTWFDEEMDRLSGWYKRRTKWFLLLWGIGLALVLTWMRADQQDAVDRRHSAQRRGR